MSAPTLEERTITSRLYDGTGIETPWPSRRRWCESAAVAHAADHRREVRRELWARRINRISDGRRSVQALEVLSRVQGDDVVNERPVSGDEWLTERNGELRGRGLLR